LHLYSIAPTNPAEKIEAIKAVFEQQYTNKAFTVLEAIELSQDKKELLLSFGENLMRRKV